MYMNYLDILSKTANQRRLAASSQTFTFWYKYWKQTLLEKAIHVFTVDTQGEIPFRAVEKILLLNGSVGITDKYRGSKGKLAAFFGENCGETTAYYDLYKDFSYNSPVDSRVLRVNKDIVMGWNNSTKTSIEPMLHTFAVLLAHTDVSIINKLINCREKSVAIAGNKTQLQSLQNYRNDLANGKVTPIYDPALSFVDFKTFPSTADMSLSELETFKKDTINLFLNFIGVKTNIEKKGNLIEAEANANDSMLVFNLEDMEECWQKLVDDVNEKYGRNWELRKSKAIDYEGGEDYDEDSDD